MPKTTKEIYELVEKDNNLHFCKQENWYSESEVQELKDTHNIEIKRLRQWSDNWKDSAQKKMLEIEKLQKENEELKSYIQKLTNKKKLQEDKELLELMETKIRGQK